MRASLDQTAGTEQRARSARAIQVSAQSFYVISLAALCAVTAYVGLVTPLRSFAHDTFFFLDNAYRVAQGQVPHRDFSSAWGPVMFLVDAAGLRLSGMRPDGIGYANALFGGLISIWAFAVVRSLSNAVYACMVGIFTALLVMAPFPIGQASSDFGIAMTYNRYGFAIFGVLVAECAADMLPVTPVFRSGLGGAVSSGVALGLLVFLKISYAVVAVPFIAACLICRAQGRLRRLLGIAIGFAAVALAVSFYLRFDWSDMLRDLAMAASSRRLSLGLPWFKGVIGVVENAPLLILALVIARRVGVASPGERWTRWRLIALASFTAVAGTLLLATNQQTDGFPLTAVAAILLLAADQSRPEPGRPRSLAIGVLTMLCCLPLTIQNAASLLGAAVTQAVPREPPGLTLAQTKRGKTLAFAPVVDRQAETEGAGEQYVAAVNDGLDLLSRRLGPTDGVLAFDMVNPFNYLLDRPSPKGGFATTSYNEAFSDAFHPPAEQVFGTTNFVIVRKYLGNPVEAAPQAGLMKVYGPALKQRFKVVEETPHWVLWARD